MPSLEDFQTKSEEDLIKEFVDGGTPRDVAYVMVNAALVTVGRKTDQQANAQGSGTWTRQEAPGAGTDHDPSPNSLPDAERQNAGDYK